MLFFYLYIFFCIVLEMFPISSSGHLQLFVLFFQKAYGLIFSASFLSLLADLLHLPIALLFFLFFIHPFIAQKGIFKHRFNLFLFIIVADGLTSIFYLIISRITFPFYFLPIGFCITALVLFSLFFIKSSGSAELTILRALGFGLVQGISLLPGISRFATTYTFCRWVGCFPEDAFTLSFSVQWPLLIAAGIKAIIKLLYFKPSDMVPFVLYQSVYMIIFATIIGWFCLCWVYSLCKNDTLKWFSLYMIFPIIFWGLLFCW